METAKRKGGKKGRKYDRNRKRHPSAMRYTAEHRWVTNKARKIERLAAHLAKAAARHKRNYS